MGLGLTILRDEPPPEGADIFWRAEFRWGEVHYRWLRVIRRTPKGAWVDDPRTGKRWCSANGRFASESKEEALARLKARTRSYLRHARASLEKATYRAQKLGVYTESRSAFLNLNAMREG